MNTNHLIHIENHEDDGVHSDTTDEYAPAVQLGKQFKHNAAISMEDIRSNSTNRKSHGSTPEEVPRKWQ
jgi:predicted transcriptional regulator